MLLDTCAVIWLANGDALSRQAMTAITYASGAEGVLISPISAWEVGRLSRPGTRRTAVLQFLPDPQTWFARVLAGPGIRAVSFTPEIAIDASFLPGDLHSDPGDRIIVATARRLGVPVITRDRQIIAYGTAGHLDVIRC